MMVICIIVQKVVKMKRYQSRIENDLSCQKEIINLIELFIKNFLEENAYGV